LREQFPIVLSEQTLILILSFVSIEKSSASQQHKAAAAAVSAGTPAGLYITNGAGLQTHSLYSPATATQVSAMPTIQHHLSVQPLGRAYGETIHSPRSPQSPHVPSVNTLNRQLGQLGQLQLPPDSPTIYNSNQLAAIASLTNISPGGLSLAGHPQASLPTTPESAHVAVASPPVQSPHPVSVITESHANAYRAATSN